MEKFIKESGRSALKPWLIWWDKRRDHISDAYRPTNAPNANLAEVCHASMQLTGGSNSGLIEAAIFDVAESLKLEQKLRLYGNGGAQGGCGPSSVERQRQEYDRQKKKTDTIKNFVYNL